MPEAKAPSPLLFIGKRKYTNKDALTERFGRIFNLPAEWSAQGRDVTLWLVDYHRLGYTSNVEGSLSIRSTPTPGFRFIGVLLTCLFGKRHGVVVASGDAYIGLLGWLIARLTGAWFVFDVYDKYDEFGGYIRPLGWDLFGFLLEHSDSRLFASRALADRVGANKGHSGIVTPNGVDATRFRPLQQDLCRQRLEIDHKLELVGYFGGMEHDRGVNDLIKAVELLRQAGRPLAMLVCGREHPDTTLSRDWIVFRGLVPHEQMPLYVNAATVVAVPYRRSEFMDMGASCKIAEYLMCRKPLVSTSTPNLTANFPIQAAEMGPLICRPGDPVDLARALGLALVSTRVISAPLSMTWSEIARDTLAEIDRSSGDHRGR